MYVYIIYIIIYVYYMYMYIIYIGIYIIYRYIIYIYGLCFLYFTFPYIVCGSSFLQSVWVIPSLGRFNIMVSEKLDDSKTIGFSIKTV